MTCTSLRQQEHGRYPNRHLSEKNELLVPWHTSEENGVKRIIFGLLIRNRKVISEEIWFT